MKEIKVPNIDYEAEIKKCKTLEDVTGKNGLLQRLFKDVMQQLLEAEMEETIGRGKYERNSEYYEDEEKNYRNGYSKKNVRSSFGNVELNIPRDRKAEFEPIAVKKYQTDCNEFDKKNNIFVFSRNEYT